MSDENITKCENGDCGVCASCVEAKKATTEGEAPAAEESATE